MGVPGVSRSKNVTGITHPQPGIYCITLAAGIEANQTGLVATPNSTRTTRVFAIDTEAADCGVAAQRLWRTGARRSA